MTARTMNTELEIPTRYLHKKKKVPVVLQVFHLFRREK